MEKSTSGGTLFVWMHLHSEASWLLRSCCKRKLRQACLLTYFLFTRFAFAMYFCLTCINRFSRHLTSILITPLPLINGHGDQPEHHKHLRAHQNRVQRFNETRDKDSLPMQPSVSPNSRPLVRLVSSTSDGRRRCMDSLGRCPTKQWGENRRSRSWRECRL